VTLAATASSASAVIIGGSDQKNQQGRRLAALERADATGKVIVVGPARATFVSEQRDAERDQRGHQRPVGRHRSRADRLSSPNNGGPLPAHRSTEQGVNALQGSANSAIGTQNLTNLLGSSRLIGCDQTCLSGGGCLQRTIIGVRARTNEQALTYRQSADPRL